MDFEPSARAKELCERVAELMEQHVYPNEARYEEQLAEIGRPHAQPPVMEEIKAEAKRQGLWNFFLPHPTPWTSDPLSNLDYAPLAEITGRSPLGPEAINCNAPDTGNMELLALFGTSEQQERWLHPLLEGEIRSCFAMTEPAVASSDATNIELRIRREGDDYVLDGRKWWITGRAGRTARSPSSWARRTPMPRLTASSRWCSCRSTRPASRWSARCPCSATSTRRATAS